jgi:O-antigen/teichoic acid export membrane protein
LTRQDKTGTSHSTISPISHQGSILHSTISAIGSSGGRVVEGLSSEMSAGIVTATLRLTGMAGRFLLLFLIGLLLTPEDLGAYGLFAVTCLLLVQVVGLELHQPAVREILRRGVAHGSTVVRAQLRVYSWTYLLLVPAATVVHLLGMLSTGHAVLLIIVIIGSHLSMEANRLLIAVGRRERAFFVLSLSQGLWVFPLAPVMFILPSTRSLSVVFATWAVAAVLAAICGYLGLRRVGLLGPDTEQQPDLAFLKQAYPSAAVFAASSFAFVMAESVDRYVLEQFRGHTEVGIYTLYASIARALREVAYAAIVTGLLPALVASVQRNDRQAAVDSARRLRKRLALLVVAGTPCLAAGLMLVVPHLNTTLYADHLPAYFVLLIAATIGTYALTPHYLLYSAGLERSILGAHLAGLVITAVALWTLVPRYGIEGAAAATLLSAVATLVIKSWAARGLPGPV